MDFFTKKWVGRHHSSRRVSPIPSAFHHPQSQITPPETGWTVDPTQLFPTRSFYPPGRPRNFPYRQTAPAFGWRGLFSTGNSPAEILPHSKPSTCPPRQEKTAVEVDPREGPMLFFYLSLRPPAGRAAGSGDHYFPDCCGFLLARSTVYGFRPSSRFLRTAFKKIHRHPSVGPSLIQNAPKSHLLHPRSKYQKRKAAARGVAWAPYDPLCLNPARRNL